MTSPHKYAVLVVEDEILVRLDLVESLEDAGFETFEAGDAAEAIGILETEPRIRVVFTDIEMPGRMDGVALSHFIRNRWPPTIVVVSSGRQRPSAKDLPSQVDFLSKPYGPGVLNTVMSGIRQRLV